MIWTEFWNVLFTKCLQYCIFALVVLITICIFMLVCVSCSFAIEHMNDKHDQAKKKNKEKNEHVEISDKLEK